MHQADTVHMQVGLMESIAIAKSLAAAAHHELDPNQELIGGHP